MSALQEESMALGLYSGQAPKPANSNLCFWLKKQYYYPACVNGTVSGKPVCAGAGGTICSGAGSSWQWRENTLREAIGTTGYVDGVRGITGPTC
jgi:hypothetical protein